MATQRDKIQVIIDFVTNKAQAGMAEISKSTTQATTKMGKLRAGAGATFATIKSQGPLAAAAAGAAFVKFGNDAVSAAASQQEQINALNRTYTDSASRIRGLGEAAAQSMGASRTEFAQAAVSFSGFVKQIASGSDETVDVLGQLMQRAADFGSRYEIQTSEAMRVFRSALAGEIEPIRKFGIEMSAAEVQAHALAKGIWEQGEAYTGAMKVQARYSFLMEQTTGVMGDFAITSEDLVNSRKRLSAQLKNLSADIGDELVPAFEVATNLANDFFDAMQRDIPGLDMGFLGALSKFDNLKFTPLDHFFDKFAEADQVFKGWENDIRHRIGLMELEGEVALETYEGEAAAMRMVAEATVSGSNAKRRYARAMELMRRATEEHNQALREQEQALKDSRREMLNIANTSLDWEDAHDRFISSIEDYNELVAAGEAGTNELEAAQRDVVRAASAMAEITLELNGLTIESAEGQLEFTSALVDQAAVLQGPARAALVAYIAEVSGIPESKVSEIVAEIDMGSVGQAKSVLNEELGGHVTDVTVQLSDADLQAMLARIQQTFAANPVPVHVRYGGPPSAGPVPYNPPPTPSGPRVPSPGGVVARFSQADPEPPRVEPVFNIQGLSVDEVEAVVYRILRSLGI